MTKLTFSDWLALAGLLFTLAGFGFALLQRRERKKLEQLAKAHAWMLMDRAGNLLGHIQIAMSNYRDTYADRLDADLVEFLAKSEAYSKELALEAVRQIQIAEGKLTRKTVDRWHREGRIPESYKYLFNLLCFDEGGSADIAEERKQFKILPYWQRRFRQKNE
jgi:CHASE1-domain containing sensor protein